MWWQVLPSMLTIGALIGSMHFTLPAVRYVFTGRPTLRALSEGFYIDSWVAHGYKRDISLTGNEYESRGLDYIPDDE